MTDLPYLADAERELLKLAEAATPGPWTFDGNCGGYIEQAGDRIARAYALKDSAFIAASDPPSVLALLSEVSRLRGVLARIRDDETDHHGAGRRIHEIARAALAPKPAVQKE